MVAKPIANTSTARKTRKMLTIISNMSGFQIDCLSVQMAAEASHLYGDNVQIGLATDSEILAFYSPSTFHKA
jgi:hypothetical protein